MLPLSLLKAAEGSLVFIELKNGETYNGRLVRADTWMNVMLSDAIRTSRDGDRFHLCQEVCIRGSAVKFFRIPEPALQLAFEQEQRNAKTKLSSKPSEGKSGYRGAKQHQGGGSGRGSSSSSSSSSRGRSDKPARGGDYAPRRGTGRPARGSDAPKTDHGSEHRTAPGRGQSSAPRRAGSGSGSGSGSSQRGGYSRGAPRAPKT